MDAYLTTGWQAFRQAFAQAGPLSGGRLIAVTKTASRRGVFLRGEKGDFLPTGFFFARPGRPAGAKPRRQRTKVGWAK
jgi:hypothetical protein